MKDVTILYQGGSGGFALYYYLLLSGNYQYKTEAVQSMIAQQYPNNLLTDPAKWKEKEFWPDNIKLKSQPGPNLYLICNPLFNSDMYKIHQLICNSTYKILLYTDLHLQLRMAYEKQAYWFTKLSRRQFNAPTNNKIYIKQIINSGTLYNNYVSDHNIPKIVEQFSPNQCINLKNFIKTKTISGFELPNNHQLKFLDYWLSIQPAKSKFLLNY
jgi:hypothetical protein